MRGGRARLKGIAGSRDLGEDAPEARRRRRRDRRPGTEAPRSHHPAGGHRGLPFFSPPRESKSSRAAFMSDAPPRAALLRSIRYPDNTREVAALGVFLQFSDLHCTQTPNSLEDFDE